MPINLNIPSPSLGINVEIPAEFINQRESVNNKNVRARRGLLESRAGTTELGASLGERVQRMFELQREDGSTDFLRIGTTKVERLDKSTGVWASIASAALTGSAQDPVHFSYPLLAGERIAVYTNGVDPIRKYTGTGNDAVLGGTPPKAKFMTYFGGYLLLAFITDDGAGNTLPFRVQWSETADPEQWNPTGTNAGSINLLEDGGFINGIANWGNYVTVHKDDSIYVAQLVSTSDVFRFDRKATGVGAVSGKAIQTIITGEQIFLASDGIHTFNGITAPLVESPIQEQLRDQMNPGYLYKAEAIVKEEDDEVWFSIPMGTSTEPDTIYKFNYRTRQIYRDVREGLTTLGLYLSTDDRTWDELEGTWDEQTWRWSDRTLAKAQPQISYGFSDGETTTENTTTTNDNGVAVESLSDTKDFTAQDLGIPDYGVLMRWKELEIWASGTNLTVEYSTNSGSSWTEVHGGALPLTSEDPTDASPLHAYFDVVSSKIRFRFSKDGLAEQFSIKKYYIAATPREKRK